MRKKGVFERQQLCVNIRNRGLRGVAGGRLRPELCLTFSSICPDSVLFFYHPLSNTLSNTHTHICCPKLGKVQGNASIGWVLDAGQRWGIDCWWHSEKLRRWLVVTFNRLSFGGWSEMVVTFWEVERCRHASLNQPQSSSDCQFVATSFRNLQFFGNRQSDI